MHLSLIALTGIVSSAQHAPLLRGSSNAAAKPNILLVLIDDLGWANVGYRAGTAGTTTTKEEAVTPNIDDLVANGVKLNRAYTYNFCSPSRSSLQSGRLPVHVTFKNDNILSYNPDDPIGGFGGIPKNMTCIAQKMKQAGYRTHATGKWDAGMATWEHTPMGRGYETWLGYYHHANDYYNQTLGLSSTGETDICQAQFPDTPLVDFWKDDGPAKGLNSTGYEEELFLAHSLEVIRSHKKEQEERERKQQETQPLFLFHSFHLVHTPLEISAEREQKFSHLKNPDRRKYAAMAHYADEILGELVGELKAQSMWDDTLMIVSSDNGGPIYSQPIKGQPNVAGGSNNMPLRGGKLSDWEGGIRVNAFVSGGAVPHTMRGKELDHYIHIADWYATLCAVAGANPTDEIAAKAGLPPIDSINMWPLLSGATTTQYASATATGFVAATQGPRTELHISPQTLISGNYKLLTGGSSEFKVPGSLLVELERLLPNMTGFLVPMDGYWPGYGIRPQIDEKVHFRDCRRGCLFDITSDPYETSDLGVKPGSGRASVEADKSMLAKMMARLAELNKGIYEPNRGNQSKLACDVAMHKWGGFYGPFIGVDDATMTPMSTAPVPPAILTTNAPAPADGAKSAANNEAVKINSSTDASDADDASDITDSGSIVVVAAVCGLLCLLGIVIVVHNRRAANLDVYVQQQARADSNWTRVPTGTSTSTGISTSTSKQLSVNLLPEAPV